MRRGGKTHSIEYTSARKYWIESELSGAQDELVFASLCGMSEGSRYDANEGTHSRAGR